MEGLLRLKKTLESAIQSLKYSLPMSHLLPEQQNELIKVLLQAAEQFKNVQDSACPFAKYLKKDDWYVDVHSGALDNKTPKNHESARAHLQ